MEQKEKSPAFQFYPKDWLTDEKVLAMTHAEQGQYFTLLCLDWLNDGLNLALQPALNGGSCLVRSCFIQHPTKEGCVTNPRLLKERQKQAAWAKKSSMAGKASGKARKIKALHNEPPFKNGCGLVGGLVEPNGNSSSSSSSSSSNNIYTAGESGKVNYPTPDSPVLLTENEIEKLTDTLGQERFDFLTGGLANFAISNPKKFREYNSHYITLLDWNKLKIQNGFDFYIHEQHGPGYYKQPQR